MINTCFLAVSLLCPLQEADHHFQSYRIMSIESATYELDQLVSQVEDGEIKELMQFYLQSIHYNLGHGNTYQ